MKEYYEYKVIEVDRCYFASDLECRIREKCRPGMRLISVLKDENNHGVWNLIIEERIY